MAKEEIPDEGPGFADVQITIIVVPGRVRATVTKLLAGARGRAGLAFVGLIAAIAAGVIIAVSSSTGHGGQSLGTYSPRLADSGAVLARFGLRLNCARITVVSPDGAYARVDLEHDAPCGTYGDDGTLILHRVHDVWVREFQASRWTCPMRRLPQSLAIELQLCRWTPGPASSGVRPVRSP